MDIPKQDVQVLRGLANRVAELAADKEMAEKADMWSRLTDLDTSVRPLLLTHLWPLAWSQVLPDETTLVCEHPDAQRYERELRQRIWTVETLNDDTVIEPVVHYPHLERSKGCVVEIILNIGGTLGANAASQLAEWNDVAKQEILDFQARN
jgi:hypothetical protein